MTELLEGRRGGVDDVGQGRQDRAVDRLTDHRGVQAGGGGRGHGGLVGVPGDPHGQGELGGVEDLDGQATADLDLGLLEGRVQAQAGRACPVAHGVGAVLLQQAHGGDDIALRLGHLLVVGVQDPARQAGVRPGQGRELQVRAHHRGEQPGADDVLPLRAQVHRVDPAEEVLVAQPARGQLGREGGSGPGVHDVELADETTGLAALVLGVAGRDVGGGVHGQLGLGRRQDRVVVDLAVGPDLVPQREGDAEEALARDQPVVVEAAHPVLVAHAHEVGVELQLAAALEQLLAQVGAGGRVRPLLAAVADVPLAGGDDLQGLVALLEEVRLTHRLDGLAAHLAGLGQAGHEGLAGREGGLAGHGLVHLTAGLGGDPLGGLGLDAPVLAQDRAQRQLQVAPPVDVRGVTEGAAHGDAGALVLLRGRVRQDRHLDAEDGGGHGGAEQGLVALVVGVGHQGHARGQQLGAGGLDAHVDAVLHRGAGGLGLGGGGLIDDVEGQAVVEAGVLARLQLGLSHRRLEGDVPQAGRRGLVGLPALEVVQEGGLGDLAGPLANGLVGVRPVHTQAEPAPQGLELLLVLHREALAQLDEVATRDRHLVAGLDRLALPAGVRGSEVRVVGQGGVAAHPEVVLDTALGGQAVVVPAHGVEHRLAAHALEAGHGVGVGVGEDVPHVQGAGDRRRRGVDGEDLGALGAAVEGVGPLGLPALAPGGLQAVGRHLGRHSRAVGLGGQQTAGR